MVFETASRACLSILVRDFFFLLSYVLELILEDRI